MKKRFSRSHTVRRSPSALLRTCLKTVLPFSPRHGKWFGGKGLGKLTEVLRHPLNRYRYVRLRWRLLCAVIDAGGYLLFAVLRTIARMAERLAGASARAMQATTPATDPDHVRRLLVVQLDHLGDAVLSTVMFPLLRRAFPRASIHVLASLANRQVFEAMKQVDHVHVFAGYRFERSGCRRWIRNVLVWGRRLRRWRYDVAIDVRGDLPIAFLMWLSGAPCRIGWTCGGGGFLLTGAPRWVPGRPEVQSRLALLAELGVEVETNAPLPLPAFPVEPTLRKWAADTWAQTRPGNHPPSEAIAATATRSAGPRVVVHAGAGTEAKRWPVEHWQRLVHLLRTRLGAQVALVGTSEELDLGEAIARYRPEPVVEEPAPVNVSEGCVTNWVGRFSIVELAAVIEQADLFIGADSGPAHLAAAVGTSTTVLFSGAVPIRQWCPQAKRVLVLRSAVPCSPCHRPMCARAGHPCMRGLSPAEVFAALARFWEQQRRESGSQRPQPATVGLLEHRADSSAPLCSMSTRKCP